MTSMRRSSNCSGKAMSSPKSERSWKLVHQPHGRLQLLHSPVRSLVAPTRPHQRTLRGDGQRRGVDGHTGRFAKWEAKGARGDVEGAPARPGRRTRVEGRQTTHEGQTSHGSSLHGPLLIWEPTPHRCGQKEILQLFGHFTLPTHVLASPGLRVPRHLHRALALCQHCPTGRVETNIRKSAFGMDQN